MNRREAIVALARPVMAPGLYAIATRNYPHPGDAWATWREAAADMARFERRALADYERLRRLGVPWLDAYEPSGVVRWTEDVSLVFATSNNDGDVSDLWGWAIQEFRRHDVPVLGSALTDCRSVGCLFVWRSKAETERIIDHCLS